MSHALVTGASRGIGKALAYKLADRKIDLVLVSLPNEGLANVAQDLHDEFKVDVKYKEVDLTSENGIKDLYEWCVNEQIMIYTLINNAGFSIQQRFDDNHLRECETTVQLNVEALTVMCSKFLPLLKQNEQSYILNVGSIASYVHVPFKAVYSASKNYVLALSNALHYELKSVNVHVSCLCPGPTITNDKVAERTYAQGYKARLLTMKAEDVAEAGVEGMFGKKRVIIPGVLNKLLIFLTKVFPNKWSISAAGRMFST